MLPKHDVRKERQRGSCGPGGSSRSISYVEHSRQQGPKRVPTLHFIRQKFARRMRRQLNGLDACHHVHGKLPDIPDGCPFLF